MLPVQKVVIANILTFQVVSTETSIELVLKLTNLLLPQAL